MDTTERQIYHFEDVEIDVVRGFLKRGDETRHLRSKTFQVLVYLIEHRGNVVSKNELIKDVWNDTAVVDDVLVQSITDIRRALGDSAHRPRFIKTIPKVGYRFVGEVVENDTNLKQTEIDQTQPPEPARSEIEIQQSTPVSHSRFVLISIVLMVAVSLILGLVGQNAWRRKGRVETVTLPSLPDKKSLVVMFFENQSNSAELDWLREGLPDMLINDLSRSEKLTVISRSQLHVLLETAKSNFPDKAAGFEETLEIARQTGAEMLVTGSFLQLGETMRFEVQLYDTKTAQLIATESLTVNRPEQILTEVDLLSLKLVRRLGVAETLHDGLSEVMTNNLQAYRYYSLGLEQAQGLHNKEAIELFEKAVALDPQFAMAQARIGYAYAVKWNLLDKGKPYLERAFALSDRLTEKDRLNIAAWYAIANQDYENATNQFRQIIAKYPLEVEAYERLALLLMGEGSIDEANAVLKQGLAIDPNGKNLHNLHAGILSTLGQHKEAIAEHQRYVALAPNEANAYDSLGLTYQWAGDYQAAIENYNRALELRPSFDIALVHLANTKFSLGQYREAIEIYRRYIEHAPSDMERGRGLSYIATVYLKKGDLNSARKTLKELLNIQKDSFWGLFKIAQIQNDEAKLRELEKRLDSEIPAANRGSKHTQRYQFYYRGYFALKSGRNNDAIAYFKEAMKQLPLRWDAQDLEDCLADAYLQTGQLDEAISENERILRLNPNYPLASFHLAEAYEKKGLPERARSAYRQFLETWKDADSDVPEIIYARKFIGQS